MDIGHKVKQLRIQKNLTLEELASRSELTKGFLSQLERNLTSPSIATLEDILEALGTSLSEFFKEEKQEQFLFKKDDFFVDERYPRFRGVLHSPKKASRSQSDGRDKYLYPNRIPPKPRRTRWSMMNGHGERESPRSRLFQSGKSPTAPLLPRPYHSLDRKSVV